MRRLLIPVLATALTLAVMAYQALGNHEPELTEPIPVEFHELEGYVSEPIAESEAELNLLPEDTIFSKRAYTDNQGRVFQVSIITNGKQRRSIHRPEVCLPAAGFELSNPHQVTVDGTDWHVITLARGGGDASTVAYTSFNQAGRRTSSHLERIFWDVWDRGILCRIDRWTQINVFALGSDEAALTEFLAKIKEVVR